MIPTKDLTEQQYLNTILIKRFPFLYEGLDPMNPVVDCYNSLMAEYALINSKESLLSSTQRFAITSYIHKIQESMRVKK